MRWLETVGVDDLLVLCLLAGAVLLFSPWKRIGRFLVACAALIVFVVAVLPTSSWLMTSLENRIPVVAVPDHVDGIVVLGGTFSLRLSRARGQPAVNASAERLLALAELQRRFPDALIVYTSAEGKIAKNVLRWVMNVDEILFEGSSKSTRQDALRAKSVAHPREDEVWLVVTSAAHMPRALGTFRAVGWRVLPYPVDYRTDGRYDYDLSTDLNNRLQIFNMAFGEWAALLIYDFRGWTNELFPGGGS
jgi:uncharacterized SAM-binding protein YcdF (DUF218 family)